MSEEQKYYTPSIEEFHHGFEYETRGMPSHDWCKKTLNDAGDFAIVDRIQNMFNLKQKLEKYDGSWDKMLDAENAMLPLGFPKAVVEDFKAPSDFYRVAFITREQIEAEGWLILERYSPAANISFSLQILSERGGEFDIISLIYNPYSHWVLVTQNNTPRFSGTIRNISEFRVLCKQLGIK